MANFYGMKELYDMTLKATYPIEIGNRTIDAGEVILAFDHIQVAGLDELKKYVSAHGGFGDRDQVIWETTKQLNLQFTQGVFSLDQLALLTNSKMLDISENTAVAITKRETLETNANGVAQLAETPVGELFVYEKETGSKLTYSLSGKNITLAGKPYLEIYVTYEYNYINGARLISVGNRLVKGFLKLQARTRLKDDNDGHTITGIIEIPKLKLMSDLSMRLGQQASPTTVSFRAVGHPVGERDASYVCNFYSLNDDIDSDL